MSPCNFPDFFGEDEFDFAVGDFFVEAHGGEELSALTGGQFDLRRQAGAQEEIADASDVAGGEAKGGGGNGSDSDLADGDGFAVEIFTVAGDVFDGVADGVAKIQNGAQASFGFILPHDVSFDFAAAGDNA